MLKRFTSSLLAAVIIVPAILLSSCEKEFDELPSQTVYKDGGYYSFSNITFSNTTDFNGNGFVPVGDVSATISINSTAPDGYSENTNVKLSITLSNGSIILAQNNNVSFSKGGGPRTVNFTGIDFGGNISEKGDYNLSIDVHQAGSDRRIISQGFLGQHETVFQDSTISYELQDVIWGTGTDANGDGYYLDRTFETRVVSLGESGTNANVSYWLSRSYRDANDNLIVENVSLGNFPNYNIQRKGFGSVITGNIDSDALGITRSEYSLNILAVNAANANDTLIFQTVTRDGSKDLAFENSNYDNRMFTINSVTQDSVTDNDGDGYARRLDYSFTVMGPALAYDTIPGTISPVVRLWYAGPKTNGELEVYASQTVTPGTPTADVRFMVMNLDSGVYNFEIDIREVPGNITTTPPDEKGLPVQFYDLNTFPVLGNVQMETDDED